MKGKTVRVLSKLRIHCWNVFKPVMVSRVDKIFRFLWNVQNTEKIIRTTCLTCSKISLKNAHALGQYNKMKKVQTHH